MTWFKLDDSFHSHPKVLQAGNEAVGLYVRCGSYCAQHLTDGFVPSGVVFLYGNVELASVLVESQLWVPVTGGWRMHDYLTYNPSKVQVQADREAAAKRQRDARERRAKERAGQSFEYSNGHAVSHAVTGVVSNAGSHGVTHAEVTEVVTGGSHAPVTEPRPDPSRPVLPTEVQELFSSETAAPPSHAEPTSKTEEPQRDDVDALCNRLAEWMVRNEAKKPTVGKLWKRAARLMLDQDKRELSKALNLIDWCQQHNFWQSKVLSMPKFREKYDQLALEARSEWRRNGQKARAQADAYNPDRNPGAGLRYV